MPVDNEIYDPAYDLQKSADYLGFSVRQVREMVRGRMIDYIQSKSHGRIRIRLSELNRYLQESTRQRIYSNEEAR